MSELIDDCGNTLGLIDLLKLAATDATGLPLIDCDNKDMSLQSILKQSIVILDDGLPAIYLKNNS